MSTMTEAHGCLASEPVIIDFALDEFDLFGDLAICLYDPLLDEYVACYSSILEEKGTFDVLQPGREFHLVVYSEHFDCGSGYDLDLLVTPLPYAHDFRQRRCRTLLYYWGSQRRHVERWRLLPVMLRILPWSFPGTPCARAARF